MKFIFAHVVAFVLGLVLATAVILQINPQFAPGEQEMKPQKRSPNFRGHPPPHDQNRRRP